MEREHKSESMRPGDTAGMNLRVKMKTKDAGGRGECSHFASSTALTYFPTPFSSKKKSDQQRTCKTICGSSENAKYH